MASTAWPFHLNIADDALWLLLLFQHDKQVASALNAKDGPLIFHDHVITKKKTSGITVSGKCILGIFFARHIVIRPVFSFAAPKLKSQDPLKNGGLFSVVQI
jgi:hypothetical protein